MNCSIKQEAFERKEIHYPKGSGRYEEVKKYYDDWSQTYDRDIEVLKIKDAEEIASYFRDHLHRLFGDTEKSTSILDIGAGTGRVGKCLRDVDFKGQIHGLDFSAGMLDNVDRNVYEEFSHYQASCIRGESYSLGIVYNAALFFIAKVITANQPLALRQDQDLFTEIYNGKTILHFMKPGVPIPVDNNLYDVVIVSGAFGPSEMEPLCIHDIITVMKSNGHVITTLREIYPEEPNFHIEISKVFCALEKNNIWIPLFKQSHLHFQCNLPNTSYKSYSSLNVFKVL